MESNPKSHEAKLKSNHLQSHTHLRQSDTDMGIRDSFSRSKKKFKHLLAGRKRKSGGTGTETGGESVSSVGSLLRPVSHIVAGGSHDLDDDRASADRRQSSADRLPQQDEPESVLVRGSETDQEGRDVGLDRGEASQVHPHPHSDVEVGVGSGPSGKGDGIDGEKVERVEPSPSAPPTSRDGEPDGMRIPLFQSMPLIIPSDDVGTPAVPDHDVPEVLRPDESEPSAAVDENKPDWKSSVSATTELLRGVKDGPLKSVATRLRFILENCEVWSSSYTSNLHYLQSS